METVEARLEEMGRTVAEHESVIVGLQRDLVAFRTDVGERFGLVDERLGRIDRRLDSMDQRFERIDQRFERVDQRFEHVDRRFDHVDQRFDAVLTAMSAGFGRLTTIIFTVFTLFMAGFVAILTAILP